MAIANIDKLDKLNTGRIKLNQAIDQTNTLQGQLDTIVLESGTSDAEVIQARGSEPLLYNRLDKVDTQLAEKVKPIELYASRFMYGYFQKPSDFKPLIPCNFFRDSNGVMQNDMDFTKYTGGTAIYVNLDTGSDSTADGSSIDTPYKTIKEAMIYISSAIDGAYSVRVLNDSIFMRDEGWLSTGDTFTNKTISLIPENASNRIMLSGGQRALSWIEDGVGTWKATRSSVRSVYDISIVDSNGLQIPYTAKGSLADCQSTQKTWYTDGTDVWVHTKDNLVPTTENIIVGISHILRYVLLGTSKMYWNNVTLLGSGSDDGMSVRGDLTGATVTGEFCAENCNFIGGSLAVNISGAHGNALAIAALKLTYLFNCKSAYAKRDGFNFHYTQVPEANRRDCFALLYGCESYNHGLISDTTSNNAFTSHEGANILLVNSNGHNTRGSVLINVNGCYTVALDCNMRDSTAGKAVYHFSTISPPAGVIGKVVLINCTHNGETLSSPDLYLDDTTQSELYYTNLPNLQPGSATPTILI